MKLSKLFLLLFSIQLLAFSLFGAAPFSSSVTATNTTGDLISPTNFLQANVMQGSNAVIEFLANGKIKIHSTASGNGGSALHQLGTSNLTVKPVLIGTNLFSLEAGNNMAVSMTSSSIVFAASVPGGGTNALAQTNGVTIGEFGTYNLLDGPGLSWLGTNNSGVIDLQPLLSANLREWNDHSTNTFAAQANLNAASNVLRSDITDLQTSTNGLNAGVGNLQTATNGLDAAVKQRQFGSAVLTNLVTTVDQNVTNAETAYFKVAVGALTLTNINLTNWAKLATNAFPTFVNLNAASNVLRSDIADLQTSTNGLNTSIGDLRTATNGLNTRLGTAEGNITDLQTSTNGLNTSIGNLRTATNGLNTRLGTAEGNITDLQTSTNGLNTSIGNLRTATNGLNTRVGNLETSTNGLDTRVVGLENVTNLFLTTNKSGFASANGVLTSLLNASNPPVIKTVFAGNGIVLTNQLTNVIWAIDPAVVASQANVNNASNTLRSDITDLRTSTNGLDSRLNTAEGNITDLQTATNRFWYQTIDTDGDGGLIYSLNSTNAFLPDVLQMSANYLTNSIGDFGTIVSLGYNTQRPVSAAMGLNTRLLNLGDSAGNQSEMTNSSDVVNVGYGAGASSHLDGSSQIYNFGYLAGAGSALTNLADVVNLGNSAGQGLVQTTSYDTLNLGTRAGSGSIGSGNSYLFNAGHFAGADATNVNCDFIYAFGQEAGRGMNMNTSDLLLIAGHGVGKNFSGSVTNEMWIGTGTQKASGMVLRVFNGTTAKWNMDFAGSTLQAGSAYLDTTSSTSNRVFSLLEGANISFATNGPLLTISATVPGGGTNALAQTNGVTVGEFGTFNVLESPGLTWTATNLLSMVDLQPLLSANLLEWNDHSTNTFAAQADLNAASNVLRSDLADLQTSTNGLNTRLGSAEGSITDLQTSTNGLNTRLGAAEGQITDLQTSTNGLDTRVGNLETSTNGLQTQINARQGGSAVLSNLVITVARNVTNIVSSTTNATSKPLTNSYTAGVLTLRGLEAGNDITLTANGSNYVIATTAASQANLNNASNVLRSDISDLQTSTNGLDSRLASAEGSITDLQTSTNGLNTRLGSAEGSIADLQTSTNGLQTQINARQGGSAVLTNLVTTLAKNVTNIISSTTNATSKPLTNSYSAGVLTLLGLEAGVNMTLTANGSNYVIATTAASQANLNNASNVLRSDIADLQTSTNGLNTRLGAAEGSITDLQTSTNGLDAAVKQRQFGSAVLTNLVTTVARNVTNIISSTTNATSKPLTNSYANGVLTLLGLEAGANMTITANGSNYVIASTASGGGGALGVNTNDVAVGTETNLNFVGVGGIALLSTNVAGTNQVAISGDALQPGNVVLTNLVTTGAVTNWADVTIFSKLGTVSFYRAATDLDTDRGTALTNALAHAVDGDVLHLAPNTFDLTTNKLDLSLDRTKGVSLLGAGMYNTIIKSGIGATTNGVIVNPGTNSAVRNLSIIGTAFNAYQQGCLGAYTGKDGDFTNAVIENVYLEGFWGFHSIRTNHATLLSCRGKNVQASVFLTSSGNFDLYDCSFVSTASVGATIGFGYVDNGGSALANLWHCSFSANGGASRAAKLNGTAASALNIFGGTYTTTGSGNLDIEQVGGVVSISPDIVYATTTGTISKTLGWGLASAVLTNLVTTVAKNVTNIVSSTTNATSKPLTNSYTAGVLTLRGLEAGGNVTITANASNYVIASSGGATVATNSTFVSSTAATNVNIIWGPDIGWKGTNASGDVSLQPYLTSVTGNGSVLFSNAPIVNNAKILNATVSRAAVFDGNGVLTNDVAYAGTGAPVLSNAPSVNNLKAINATVSSLASFDANGVLTNTVAVASPLAFSGNALTAVRIGVYRTVWVDAGAMVPNSTLGAQFSSVENTSPTNRMVDSYIFTDATTNTVQFKIAMPLEWDFSTVKFKLVYTSTNASATATNVWRVKAAAISHNEAYDQDWGTAQTITNKISGANLMQLTAATQALTVGGSPAAGDVVWFQVGRLGANVDDADTGQSLLLGAWLQYKETTTEQASW